MPDRAGRDENNNKVMTSGASVAADKDFLMDAAVGGMTEVQTSRIESKNGSDARIKQFARQMVSDHTAVNNKVMTMAAGKNVDLPPKLDSSHQAMVDALTGKSGVDLDKAYLMGQIDAHKEAISVFERAAQNASPDIQKFANDTLPTIRHHLHMAQEIMSSNASMSGSGM